MIVGCAIAPNEIDWYRKCIIKADFDGGRLEGPFELYTPNGQIQQKGTFANGKKKGIWKYWESTGIKIAEIEYKNGEPNGPIRLWYGSFINSGQSAGALKLEGKFHKGSYDGKKITYHSNGFRRTEIWYDRGDLKQAAFYDTDGLIVSVGEKNALKYAEIDLKADLELLEALDEVTYDSIIHSKSINKN